MAAASARGKWTCSTMPEGHTIHRAARDQIRMLADHVLEVTSPQGRFSEGAQRLDGLRCMAVEAFGKHLIYRFGQDTSGETLALHIHLGLFGRFRTAKAPGKPPKGAVRVRMVSPTHVVDINGPNTCEILDPPSLHALVDRIGPDVLRSDADPGKAWARIGKSRAAIGLLLMDQSVIAGIGNIYRSEILWRQGIHPETPGRDLDRAIFDLIWNDAVQLLKIGVAKNAIITAESAMRSKTRYAERVNIFGKNHCPTCHSEIAKSELAGRRVFTCETCQPRL